MLHSKGGHDAYLNGHLSMTGWWYYYPEAILIKSPTSFVVGLLIAMGTVAVSLKRGRGASWCWRFRQVFMSSPLFAATSTSACA